MFGHSHSHGHGHHQHLLEEGETHSHLKTQALKRLVKLAGPEKWYLLVSIISLLFSAAVNLIVPWTLGVIVGQESAAKATSIMFIMIPVFLGGVCFTCIRGYLFTYAGERLIRRLRMQLFSSLTSQEIGFFDENKTGELINRLVADTTLIQSAATMTSAMILRFGIQILGGSIVLMVISWKLTLVMLIPIPLGAIVAWFFGRWMKTISTRLQDALAKTTGVAEETITHMRLVRSFSNEAAERSRYQKRIDESFNVGRRMAKAVGALQGGAELATYATILLVVWYGAVLALDGDLEGSSLTSFLLYALTVAHALGAFSNHIGDMLRALGASERVFELIDREPRMNIEGGDTPSAIHGQIVFDHVSFTYPSRLDKEILNDFSLELKPGQVVGVVGASGSGKTTLAHLALRLYDVVEGCIRLDGTDIRRLDPRWLRNHIGFVGQDPVLFDMTIRENISYGRPNATLEEVVAAAKASHIHDFVISLADGYETMCGERGVRMSGGQKQRIAIARALVKDPKIIIFDEATSALDSENERLVQRAMEEVVVGRTVLIIAHRISTVKRADVIITMEGGKIVETGRHEELMALGGLYHKLVTTQLQNDE